MLRFREVLPERCEEGFEIEGSVGWAMPTLWYVHLSSGGRSPPYSWYIVENRRDNTPPPLALLRFACWLTRRLMTRKGGRESPLNFLDAQSRTELPPIRVIDERDRR